MCMLQSKGDVMFFLIQVVLLLHGFKICEFYSFTPLHAFYYSSVCVLLANLFRPYHFNRLYLHTMNPNYKQLGSQPGDREGPVKGTTRHRCGK